MQSLQTQSLWPSGNPHSQAQPGGIKAASVSQSTSSVSDIHSDCTILCHVPMSEPITVARGITLQ